MQRNWNLFLLYTFLDFSDFIYGSDAAYEIVFLLVDAWFLYFD